MADSPVGDGGRREYWKPLCFGTGPQLLSIPCEEVSADRGQLSDRSVMLQLAMVGLRCM